MINYTQSNTKKCEICNSILSEIVQRENDVDVNITIYKCSQCEVNKIVARFSDPLFTNKVHPLTDLFSKMLDQPLVYYKSVLRHLLD